MLNLPDHAVLTLDNGLTLLALPRKQATTATLMADVRVGSRDESEREAGLSHVLEHMVFQGCPGFADASAVNEAAERLGTVIDAATSRESTHFEQNVAPESLGPAVSLLSRLLIAPAFADLESERRIILEEAKDEVDERGRVIDPDTLSRALLWPQHPLGRPIIGDVRNIHRFDVETLRRYHAQHYVGDNTVVAVTGPYETEQLLDLLRLGFGELPRGERPAREGPLPGRIGPTFKHVDDARSQVDCRLLFRTVGRHSPQAFALQMLRIALDDGLASRMHRRLGTELGLCYEQWATWESYADTGAFELAAVVSTENVPAFFKEAFALLHGLAERPPNREELARLRFRARFTYAQILERPEPVLGMVASALLDLQSPTSPLERAERLFEVTTEEIAQAASQMLEEKSCVAVAVGPLSRTRGRRVKDIVEAVGR